MDKLCVSCKFHAKAKFFGDICTKHEKYIIDLVTGKTCRIGQIICKNMRYTKHQNNPFYCGINGVFFEVK